MSPYLILKRLMAFVGFAVVASLFVGCDRTHDNDPQPGIPNARYFNLIASANLSIREAQHFQGGFTDFAQLEFHPTLKQLEQRQHIHWLSAPEQALIQQHYQAELRQFAPSAWASQPQFMAATVINSPANYLILFVEVTHANKPSSLAMLRIQNGFEFYSPPVMVSGYVESSMEQEKVTRWPSNNKAEHHYTVARVSAGNPDFSAYEYFLTTSDLCSFHDRQRLGVGEITLRVASRPEANVTQKELATFPIREALPSDLPCWQQNSAISSSPMSAVADRSIGLRVEQLHPDGVLLSIRLGYTLKAYPSQIDQKPKMILVWCRQFTRCETAFVQNRRIDNSASYDDTRIAAENSLFIATDAQTVPHLQIIRWRKIADTTASCWQPQVEQSIKISADGVKPESKGALYLPHRTWSDYSDKATIRSFNTSPAQLLAGVQAMPLCHHEQPAQ